MYGQGPLEWVDAWMTHKPPTVGNVGFMYMLAGGTVASNVDPYAKKPTAGNQWIKTGPHVMIVGAEPRFYDMYPKNAPPHRCSLRNVVWNAVPAFNDSGQVVNTEMDNTGRSKPLNSAVKVNSFFC